MVKVFVYGTLKRGFPLFDKGMSGALYLGDVETVEPYPMYIAKDFYGPVMLDEAGEGLQVMGELFEVEEGRLPLLDELESVGSSGSFRTTLEVQPRDGGIRTEAIGFVKDRTWLDPLHSGPLADYQDRRFVPPWERSS